ncbi:hypothetical protein GGI35DRAFT_437184 [Trichoderma velutinum]
MGVRRSACDRCKTQRLRCLRAGNGTNPCDRCIRAKVNCETGPTKPTGRPRKAAAIASTSVQLDQNPPRTNVHQASQHGALDQPSTDSGDVSQSIELPMILSLGYQIADTSIGSGATDSPTEAINALCDYSNPLTMWNDSGDLQLFFEDVAAPEPVSFLEVSAAAGQQQSVPSHIGLVRPDLELRGLSHRMVAEFPDVLQGGRSTVHSKCKNELYQLASLSRLSERTSKVAFDLISLIGEPPTSPEPCIMLMEQPETNPMAQALVCSEEFLVDIKSLISLSPSSDKLSSSAASNFETAHLPNKQESPSIPTLLLVFSIYSQLRKLYDLLFSHIHRSLSQFSDEVLRLTRIRSVIRVGALPPMREMQANLYTWMIVQVMQGNAQNMDHYMGLLARYCYSLLDTRLDGPFANTDLKPILQRIIDRANGDVPKAGGIYVDSLQQNIQKVLGRLGSI